MAKRLFHIPVVVSPDDPSVCTLQVAKAPLSAVGAPDPNGDPLPKTMSDVHIELWEADRLLPDGGKEDDLLATFVVDLALAKDGSVTVAEKDIRIEPMPADHIGLGTLKVCLETGAGKLGPSSPDPHPRGRIRMAAHWPGWAKPRATTELAITVKSDYPDETTRTTINLLEQGFLPSGPVAAFISLQPHDANLRQLAEWYWREHADLVHIAGSGFDGSLQEITKILANSDQVFQEVNIIAHGTEDGLTLFSPDSDPKDSWIPIGWGSFDALVVQELRPRLTSPSNALSKAHSRVVVRGCTIGRDRQLLRELSACFGGVRTYGAADQVLYLYEPHRGRREYYLLRRYFTPTAGHARDKYLGSAKLTAALLDADTRHGEGKDLSSWAKHRESHWSSKGVLPRYFRNGRHLDYDTVFDGVQSKDHGRSEFWSMVQDAASSDGADERYRLATYNPVVDPDAITWTLELEAWCKANDWELDEKFSSGRYSVTMRRTHVVIEVLVTDPQDDPDSGVPVPLDLDKHFVSEKA